MAAKAIENKSGLIPIVFALWAAALIAVFFAYRGSDVGELPALLSPSAGPWFGGKGLIESVAGLFLAAVVVASWFGLGSFISSLVRPLRPGVLTTRIRLVLDTAVGAAAWSLTWFFLGLVGGYTFAAAIGAGAIGVALAAVRLPSVIRNTEVSDPEKYTALEIALAGIILVPLLLALVASLASPIAKDTLLYHFSVPKVFIAQGGSGYVEGNIASYLPLGAEMHNVWAMLLGRLLSDRAAEAAAGAVNFAFFPLLLAAVYGWAREFRISRSWSLIAAAMIATVPTAYHVAANEYVDVALALFITLALYAVSRWWDDLGSGWLVYIAVFLGAALSIKFTALVVIAAVALVILLRARKETGPGLRKVLIGGFGALVLAGAIASPWYVRTWKETGSPIFPFYMNIWKGNVSGWDVERSQLFQQMNSQYGGESKSALDYVATPFSTAILAQPEKAAYFDGVIGVGFLIGLPILVMVLWKYDMPVGLKAGLGIAAVLFLFWSFSSQQLRYLLPILPVLAIAIVFSSESLSGITSLKWVFKAGFIAATLAGVLVSAAWFLRIGPVREVLGGESKDDYLTRNLDYYPYYRTLNTDTPADSKVWLINMRRDSYYLDRPYFSDYLFEDWTLKKMVWEARSTDELRSKTAAMGIQYVLARHDYLFDYAQSTIVDDSKSKPENIAKLAMTKSFLLDPARTIKADNKFSLIKVF